MSKLLSAPSFLGLFFLLAARCCIVSADTQSFTLDLLARYAPLIYLYPGETFLPSSIDYALEYEQVLLNSTLARSVSDGAQPSALNESNLNFQTKSNAGSSYLTTQQALGCDTCQNPSFLRGQDPVSNSIPVYTIVIQRDANTTSVYYWLFFPFNYGRNVGLCFNNLPEALLGGLVSKVSSFFNRVFGGSSAPSVGVTGPDAKLLSTSSSQSTAKCQGFQQSIGNHVGDWEHVEIKFDSRTSPPTPQYVRLSQHDGGQIYNWGDPALKIQNGTHPVAFAANGSHALYASTGVHQYTNMTILDNVIGLTDTVGQGTLWDTSEEMVVATWRSDFNYTGDQSWLAWAGKWGNEASGCTTNPINALIQKASGECPLSSGLSGPAYYMGPNVN